MATVTKYMFDRRFDDPEEIAALQAQLSDQAEIEQEGPVEEEEEEEIPTFSQEELDAARAEGFASGKDEGIREAGDALEQRSSETLDVIAEVLNQLFHIQEQENDRIAEDSMNVAVAVVRKLFPDMAARDALGETESLFKTVISRLRTAPSVSIQINDALAETSANRLSRLSERAGFEGQLKIVTSPDTPLGDCQITWGDGGAERNSEALWHDIDAIIAGNVVAPENTAPVENTVAGTTRGGEIAPELETVVEGDHAVNAPDDNLTEPYPLDLGSSHG